MIEERDRAADKAVRAVLVGAMEEATEREQAKRDAGIRSFFLEPSKPEEIPETGGLATDTQALTRRVIVPEVITPGAGVPERARKIRRLGRVKLRGDGGIFWKYPTVCYIRYSYRGKEEKEPAARLQGNPETLSPEELTELRSQAEAVALRKLRARKDEIARKEFVGPKEERRTVGELLDSYIEYLTFKEKKSARTVGCQLAGIRERFGLMRAVNLTTERLSEYMTERKAAGAKPKTINNEVVLLKCAYNRAVKKGRIIRVPYVELFTVNNVRDGFFERAEFETLVKYLPEPIDDIARFAYLTGWRKGEILPLPWTRIDRVAREVTLRTSKNGKPRRLALEGELWELIERRWQARTVTSTDGTVHVSEYVFGHQGKYGGTPRPYVNIDKSWKDACKKANLPGKLFHDFRRTAARDMIRAGVPQSVCMDITGHETDDMFDRYNITDVNDTREALKMTAAHRATMPTEKSVISFPSTPVQKRAR